MNQIRILNNKEKKTKNEIEINLDSEHKLAFNIDTDYITTLAMEHLTYKFDKNARINKKSFKRTKGFFCKYHNEIANIISENLITMIETLASLLIKSEDMQQKLEGLNFLNLEAYIFTLISENITNEMFALYRQTKKDELK